MLIDVVLFQYERVFDRRGKYSLGNGCCLWRRWRRLKSCVLSHHTREGNSNALNDSKENSASNCVVAHGFGTASDGESTT